MNIFSERLKNALSERGMKQTELSERTGISKSSISEWLNGRYEAKADKIVLIARALNVNESYLIGLDVPMENEAEQSSTKTILDNIFNKLEKPRQEIVINTAQEQLDEQNKEKTIKLFSYNVQEKLSAGTGYGYFDDGNYDTVYYNEQYDYDFASWIFGDSMLPDYPNGDVALIKACPFEYDGCVYAVDWDGQSYIKKVYKEEKGLRLVSTNEKYSDKFAPFTEEPRIIGKVVASFTPLEK